MVSHGEQVAQVSLNGVRHVHDAAAGDLEHADRVGAAGYSARAFVAGAGLEDEGTSKAPPAMAL